MLGSWTLMGIETPSSCLYTCASGMSKHSLTGLNKTKAHMAHELLQFMIMN